MMLKMKILMKLLVILMLNLSSIQAVIFNSTKKVENLDLNDTKKYSEFFKLVQNFIIDLDHENVSVECKKSNNLFKKSLHNLEFWALQMFDANAKISSGLLNGNIHQFGNFDQCINTASSGNQFQGKYCLSHIMFDVPESLEYLNLLKHRMLALNPFVSEFDDASHIVPKSSEVKWASCIPSNCAATDLGIAMKESLTRLFNEFPIKIRIQINEVDCQVRINEKLLSVGEKLSIGLFVALFTVIVASTFAECFFASENSLMTSFSLKKNFNELILVESSNNDIKCMHSIRTILTVLLITAHKAMEHGFNPVAHKTQMIEFLLQPINLIFRISYLHTDVFLMFSGFLVTQTFMAKIKRGQKINIFKEIIGRYFRLIPSIAILIIFVTFILPNLGSGPLWPILIEYQSDLCKKTWLSSIFMVQNLIGIENICMMHTHHVATDFQLFLIAPVVAVCLCKYHEKTVKLIVLLSAVSTFGRFLIVYFGGISVFMTAGMRISDIFKIADLMYILPPYRFTVYSMGILLAYYINKHKGHKIAYKTISTGWIWAISSLITTVAISAANDKQTLMRAALFASICSITYCGFFGWIIYSSELGFEIQFAVFHYNNGKVRGSTQYSFYGSIVDLNELFIILLSATVLTVCIDYPFKNIKKAFSDKKSAKIKQ
ncbi:unnamed protein product [Chironomus riparius]|uniref:Nose resistant-to-fluoxetine protein N-terminal domain-containing protein n=1 Tax=Chironomus riparius TaxID=315576 RepID=A0A9N9S6N6_9DIPT|nr:unnamed protein product [Chironomus riparius]